MIECKLVHMFIHCNLWLVSLLNADSLSVSFLYDWIVTTFPCEKLLFILIENNYLHRIWTYNCYKRTTDIHSIWISNMCFLGISVAWPYRNQLLLDTSCLSNQNTRLEHFQQAQLRWVKLRWNIYKSKISLISSITR